MVGLFYFAENEHYPQLSTKIHSHKSGLKSWRTTPKGVKLNNKDFRTIKEITYMPNKFFLFVKTDNSWHSVNVTKNPIKRYTCYYSILGN